MAKISDQASYPAITPVGGDYLILTDVSDTNKTKTVTVQSLSDFVNPSPPVVGITSANSAIAVSGTTSITLTSTAYGGGATIGHVPTGGTANNFLKGNGSFSAVNVATDVTGIIAVENGGIGKNSYTAGDIIYAATAGSFGVVGIGTAGQVLKVNSGATAPEWSSDTDTTYTAGEGLDLTGTVFSAKLRANGGVIFDGANALAVDLGASSITGNLPAAAGGTGLTSISTLLNSNAAVNSYINASDNRIITSGGAGAIVGESNFTFTGSELALSGQFVATAGVGANVAIRGIASNSQSTQGWNANLGVANFDQNDTGANCTTIAVNTESTNGKLISFYYQENTGTGPKGEIKFDTSSSQVQYNVTSDYRLKENVLDLSSAIDRVKNLKPKRFNFIGNSTEIDGFLAHEVQEVVPQAVSGVKDQVFEDGQVNPQQMDASKLIPVLTAAIKELTARVEALEA